MQLFKRYFTIQNVLTFLSGFAISVVAFIAATMQKEGTFDYILYQSAIVKIIVVLLLAVAIVFISQRPIRLDVLLKSWFMTLLVSVFLYAVRVGFVFENITKLAVLQTVLPNVFLVNQFITALLIASVLKQFIKSNMISKSVRLGRYVWYILLIISPLFIYQIHFLKYYLIIASVYLVLLQLLMQPNIQNNKSKQLLIVSNVILLISELLIVTGVIESWQISWAAAILPVVMFNTTYLLFKLSKLDWMPNQLNLVWLGAIVLIAFNQQFVQRLLFGWYQINTIELLIQNPKTILFTSLLILLVAYMFSRLSLSLLKNHDKLSILRLNQFHFVVGIIYSLMLHAFFYRVNNATVNEDIVTNMLMRPGVVVFDFILLIALYLIICTIVNRVIIANAIFMVVTASFTLANYLKVIARDEPILPSELGNIKILPTLIQMVETKYIIIALVLIILAIVSTIILQKWLKPSKFFKIVPRVIVLILSCAILVGSFYSVTEATTQLQNTKQTIKRKDVKLLKKINYTPYVFLPLTQYRRNGEMISLLSLMDTKIMAEPTNYSANKLQKVMAKYEKFATQLNQKRTASLSDQTVIYILSESLSNPDRMPGVNLSTNPLKNLDQIKSENTSGLMYSLGYGGGTANIEYETLTGYSMNNFDAALTTPYLYLVPKMDYTPTILDSFKHKTAIHPYVATTYSREKVFDKFGFQHFYSLSGKDELTYKNKKGDSWFIDDDSAFKEVLKQLDRQEKEQFIQLTTIQNHTPFDNKYINQIPTTSKLKDNSMLETYVQGLRYSDYALAKFMKKIDKMDRKITVVFYGDHLPGFYNYQTGYQLPNNFDQLSHQTDYFIHSNFKTQDVSPTDIVAPSFFTPMVLAKTDSKVTPYQALLTSVWQKTPPAERQKYMTADKMLTKEQLTNSQKEIINDYQLIQYDLTAGKQYSLKDNKAFYQSIP